MEIIGDRYVLQERLASGAFGIIFQAWDKEKKEYCVAKLESADTSSGILDYEFHMYKQIGVSERIPRIYDFYPSHEVYGRDYNVLMMEHAGQSIENLFDKCKRRFSVKTVCMLAIEMLHCIELLHERMFLHRDIKPDNFTFKNGKIYILDFGLCKRYRHPDTNEHITYKENKSITGTPRYASINSHLGIQMSRRDDLESLAYCLIYFLRGSLPWMGIRATSKRSKYNKILEKKMATPIDLLCAGYPEEFYDYLCYVRSLRFADKPDYAALRGMFERVAARLEFTFDGKYDWDVLLEAVKEDGAEADDTRSNSSVNVAA
jgi:serine/threonine protein kinase